MSPERLEHAARVELEPADPFELIRWLARSQPDPRKAVAELIQNSLDAGATRIQIERAGKGKNVSLRIRDDGEGVLPKMERRAALRHLASHIGHSHKLHLDPGERARRVVAGQYGVGLLGFWAIGKQMEIHSRVGGGRVAVLRMFEDSPEAEVGSYLPPKGSPKTYTEVVVSGVHDTAKRVLGGNRLSAYLSVELRGQLLRSGCKLAIHDALARGDNREILVEPHRYTGEPLELPRQVRVPGHRPFTVELYVARGMDGASIELACAGTRVAEDISEVDAFNLSGPPWRGAELTGIIDFPDFSVPPGTRRGVLPNDAALAFLEALAGITPAILGEIERLDTLHRAQLDHQIVRDLRRALRGFDDRVRELSLPPVAARGGSEPGEDLSPGLPADAPPRSNGAGATAPAEGPVGPLAQVSVVPAFIRVSPGQERSIRAVARDAEGRRLRDAAIEWRFPDGKAAHLTLEAGERGRATLRAADQAPLGRRLPLMAVATHEDETAADIAAIEIVEEKHEVYARLGIPEPILVSAPGALWRSRRHGFAWEINDAHPDYLRVADNARRRLRYLIALLAKEIVITSTRRNDAEDVLEAMVQVLAHAEGNLR
ncbi:MAG: ATP-binding protein [Polyangiaceae bacterium]